MQTVAEGGIGTSDGEMLLALRDRGYNAENAEKELRALRLRQAFAKPVTVGKIILGVFVGNVLTAIVVGILYALSQQR